MTARSASLLATRYGKLLLLLLCEEGMTAAHEDIKGAVAGAIKARLAAAQPLAEVL